MVAIANHIDTVGSTERGEEIVSNGKRGDARISICVPTWKDGADALFASLIRLPGAKQCTLLIFDDGSQDSDLTRQLTRQIRRFPGPARLISACCNRGRSHARNRLFKLAETDWVLYLDADMQPDDQDFLDRYLHALDITGRAAIICGGFSLRHAVPTAETRLHAAQSHASECLPAAIRAKQPGRYVFTSNLLVHRDVLRTVDFDPGFEGWGWEDVDWGLRAERTFPIHHIDNPATHLGLDTDATLIEKYTASADNFVRLLNNHPEQLKQSRLYRLATRLSHLPFRPWVGRAAQSLAQLKSAPLTVRLFALKLFRAASYGGRL